MAYREDEFLPQMSMPGLEETRPDDNMTRMEGTVEHIIYCNEENGYTVFDFGIEASGEVITAQGITPYVTEGDTLVLWGSWIHSPKYGRQFKVSQYERHMPADTAAILRYLSSRTIKGVGPKLAARIVETFGEDTLEVMENHPEWLSEVQGISRKKAEEISEDFRSKAGIRSAMMFFRDYFGAATTVKIYKTLGSGCVDIAKKNPYRLCDEVEGVGFERADQMAMAMGLDPEGNERLMSGVKYLLTGNAQRNGHVCLPREKLTVASAQLLNTTPEKVEQAVDSQLVRGELIKRKYGGQEYIFDAATDKQEQYIADKLVLLDKLCPAIDAGDIHGFIAREEMKRDMAYAAGQKQAIDYALEHGVMILTGGPGTGKTTVVRALLGIFSSLDFQVALAAPTGRAAKRLSEATSCEAKTIHRLLEMDFSEGDRGHFRRNEQDHLEEHVIIVDEASMVDNFLMCALLKAIKPGARLILIGDADQLPSVGAGRVLNDLIDSGCFATVRLTEIFRQARESLIVTNAHAVNEGQMPDLTVKNNDFFFMPRATDCAVADTIVELYGTRLPRAYGKETEGGIQVITPSRRGEAGTENLNRLLQSALNPPARHKKELKFRETAFREGDRVMQTKNNYDILWESEDGEGSGIFNGDIGTILRIDPIEREMIVRFDDREAIYHSDMLDELEHAWAVTVHKSQGSEYPYVIIPMYAAPPMLLTRNLLYTAVTRARRMVILVGREDIVATMVRNNHQTMRYTGLVHRLTDQG
ncbi:MAG: ATP-dependent RecD-like DNA helicase [Clostridia bacterium]|nr:ATP-dependent RecD-like DNA helicase [Clostridia bacterium]MBQ9781518.1 ATP-dependent RecD-like DNA helicase [Clostridia bacterium]